MSLSAVTRALVANSPSCVEEQLPPNARAPQHLMVTMTVDLDAPPTTPSMRPPSSCSEYGDYSGEHYAYRSAAPPADDAPMGDAAAAAHGMARLDALVAAERRQAASANNGEGGVDDGTLNSILGALQDQFKPDGDDDGEEEGHVAHAPSAEGHAGASAAGERAGERGGGAPLPNGSAPPPPAAAGAAPIGGPRGPKRGGIAWPAILAI